MPNEYIYDPAEHRTKHCGRSPQAHFITDGSTNRGICPSNLSKSDAQILLRSGVSHFENEDDAHPSRIYAVHNGVIYEARPTMPGSSYHGFPWRGRPGHNRLPRAIKRELENHARQQGCLDEFKSWFNKYEC